MSTAMIGGDSDTAGIPPEAPAVELGAVNTPGENGTAVTADTASQPSQWAWETDPQNPYNWTRWEKNLQLLMISAVAFIG